MPLKPQRIHELLNPTSVALVGASEKGPWATGFQASLRAWDAFSGGVYMVNPSRREIFGQVCYPSLAEVPAKVDHAVILVAAERVYGAVEQCLAAGVRNATVIASGFDEAGPAGRELSASLKELCVAEDFALVGPNCFGFNNYRGTYVSRYVITVPPAPGAIGMSFQSGQLGASTMDACYARGIKLAYGISSGNELIADWNDYAEFFLESSEIKVLGGVLERIPDPVRFASIARRALDAGKPIVVLKPGRSAAATQIAIAHTGSVTGSDAIADAFLRDLGVIRVDSIEELAETAGLLAKRGWPVGARVSYVGLSGGASELFAEQAHGTLLEFPEHTPEVRAELSRLSGVAEEAVHNPFDVTADLKARANYDEIVRTVAAVDEIDIVVTQGSPYRTRDMVQDPYGPLRAVRERYLTDTAAAYGKFSVMLETSDTQPGESVYLHEPDGEQFYALGWTGVRAIVNAATYGSRRGQLMVAVAPPERRTQDIGDLIAGGGVLSETASKALLSAYGIPVTEDILVTSSNAAVAAAERVGYPVVMKVVAPTIAHKSEVGGVRLGIADSAAVVEAYEQILTSVAQHAPGEAVHGVLVTRQLVGGSECLAGVTSDPRLGHAVVAGMGGIYVEVLNEVALTTPPVTVAKATAALASLRSYPILQGTRGQGPRDVAAFADVLVRLGRLVDDLGAELIELDINPLFVFPDGCGVIAGDALVVLR